MKEKSSGKKGAAIVLHSMFVILMFTNLFAMQYHVRERIMSGKLLYTILAMVGLFGSFICLAILTDLAGKETQKEGYSSKKNVDKIPFDLFVIIAFVFILLLNRLIRSVHRLEFDLAGAMVAAGTISFVIDLFFLAFFLSTVRRIKMDSLLSNSLIASLGRLISTKRTTHRPLCLCTQKARQSYLIQDAIEAISHGKLDTILNVENFHGQQKDIAEAVNRIGEGMKNAVSENTKNERMKADLITNVSHDIKTPLTSIINYVDLLKHTDLQEEKAKEFIRIIDEKSHRLKVLTEELVDASKISSGNIKLEMQRIDFVELMYQTGGEFNERFEARDLTIVTKIPNESIYIEADGRQLYRVVENLYTNASKYALEKTRVYVELARNKDFVTLTMKNIAKNPDGLHKFTDLTDRFVRGEESRTTEGSGLGLSIAKNLTLLMNGSFDIQVEDDLFIASISFKIA